MSFIEYQESLDMGSVGLGSATFRAQLLKRDKWIELGGLSDDPVIQSGGHELGEYLSQKIEANPERAARLVNARKRMAESIAQSNDTVTQASSLAELRLRAGLSQSQLALRMQTHQPGIARWEKMPSTMQFDTMQSMARALGLGVQIIAATIDRQLTVGAAHADSAH